MCCSAASSGRPHARTGGNRCSRNEPEAPKQAPASRANALGVSNTRAERAKPKSRQKIYICEPTLEQMRMAERLLPSGSTILVHQSEEIWPIRFRGCPNTESSCPRNSKAAKKETRSEQTSTSVGQVHKLQSGRVGAVRPTFMESGRSEPSSTPLPKRQTPAP